VEDADLERRAMRLWKKENPARPWLPIAQRVEPGQDLSTGATEDDRERYRERVRNGEII
jgi:hypothetical protein